MCDTWVALADATATGQVIFAKNSDRPIFDCQPLTLHPRAKWPKGATLELEHVVIPQAEETYATLGSGPYWCWGYEEGINEHRVAIGNEAIYTRTFREQADAHRAGQAVELGLLGMDLIRLVLERSRSAVEAVEVMGRLVERYGQFGCAVPTRDHATGGYDNSFIVADPTEAWVFEALGRRWVARRVTGGAASISNQMSIRGTWDAGSADLEGYARGRGWWPADAPFDVSGAYIDHAVPRQISHIRASRSQQLLAERQGRITPEWMMRVARDHYEGTFLHGPAFDAASPDFLTICMHVSPANFTWGNTASSCVAPLPADEATPPVFWWTPGPPCNGCYVPFFVHGRQLPETVSRAGTAGKSVTAPHQAAPDTWAPGSYWWMFRRLLDAAKGDEIGSRPGYYPARNQLVRSRFDALEGTFAAELPAVLARYAESGSPDVLDRFTAACVERVVAAAEELLQSFEESKESARDRAGDFAHTTG
jgi:secernin